MPSPPRTVQTAVNIATIMVETLEQELSATLPTVLSASLQAQAAIIGPRLAEPLAAITSLQATAGMLEQAGLDTTGIQAQLAQLVEAVITDTMTIIGEAMLAGAEAFDDVLRLVLAIPQQIAALEANMRPLSTTVQQSLTTIADLERQIAESGDAVSVVLPLYDQLRQAIIAQGQVAMQIAQQMIDVAASLEQTYARLLSELVSTSAALEFQFEQLLTQLTPAIAGAGTATPDELQALIGYTEDLITLGQEAVRYSEELAQEATQLRAVFRELERSIRQTNVRLMSETQGVPAGIRVQEADLLARIGTAFGGATPTTAGELQTLIGLTDELISLGQQSVQYGQELAREASALRSESQQAFARAEQANERRLQLEEQHRQLTQRLIQQQADDAARAAQQQARLAQEAADQAERLAADRHRQLQRVSDLLRTTAVPTVQLEQIRDQLAPLEASLAAGQATTEELDELIRLNEELIRLGQETNRLDLVQEAQSNLAIAEAMLLIDTQRLDVEAEMLRYAAEQAVAWADFLQWQAEVMRLQQAQLAIQQEAHRIYTEWLQAQRDAVTAQQEGTRLAAQADAKQAEANSYLQRGYELQTYAVELQHGLLQFAYLADQKEAEANRYLQAGYELQIVGFELQLGIHNLLAQQLFALTGTTDAQFALISIQAQSLQQLAQINANLFALYVQAAGFQAGGVIGTQQGRLIPARLEPGELGFMPRSQSDLQALMQVNSLIPRFGVGGETSGDSVPALLPAGTFILNRRASAVVSGPGYQAGG